MASKGAAAAPRLSRGVGECFLPAAGAVVLATGDDDLTVLLVGTPGAPVHATCGGHVTLEGGVVVLHGVNGNRWEHEHVTPVDAAIGRTVEAGAIIGHFADPAAHGSRLRVSRDDGTPADAATLLLGAPDPNELGYGDHDLGLDVDPALPAEHRHDLRRAGSATTSPHAGGASQDDTDDDVVSPPSAKDDAAVPAVGRGGDTGRAHPDGARRDDPGPPTQPETSLGQQHPADEAPAPRDGADVDEQARTTHAGSVEAGDPSPAARRSADDATPAGPVQAEGLPDAAGPQDGSAEDPDDEESATHDATGEETEARKAAARLLMSRPPRRRRP